jgi:MFS family permease
MGASVDRSERRLGREFAWMWGAYTVSSIGTWLAFGAFPIIAILVLDSGPAEVSALAAVGLAAGALAAIPLAPWIELRRKRRVMIASDLVRLVATASIPVAYALGWLGFGQLLVVAVIVSAADIAFKSASGAFLKHLVRGDDLMLANGRIESTMWTTAALGPPLGGALIGILGPVATVIADAGSYLLSALGLTAVGHDEPQPQRPADERSRTAELLEGWRYIFGHPTLRPLFLNAVLFSGLLLATEPLLSVLMLGKLGFAPWEYGLAFAAPCIGGLIGSHFAHRLVDRLGQRRVMLAAGTLRVVFPLWLAFIPAGPAGVATVFALQLCLVTTIGVFLPTFATYRLQATEERVVARVLAAWSVSSSGTIAALTALWGLLAAATGPRFAIFAAGVLLLATPVLLPWRTSVRSAPGRIVAAWRLK